MRKTRFLAMALVTMLLVSALTIATAAPESDFNMEIDLLRDVTWPPAEFDATLKDDGMHVYMVSGFTHVTIPLDITVDIMEVPYMYMKISGHPTDKIWNWALEYTDKNGVKGTIKCSDDYLPNDTSVGDYDAEFDLSGHFNYRINVAGETIDTSSITFTEMRYFSASDAETEFVINKLYLASLANAEGGEAPAEDTPAGTEPAVTEPKPSNSASTADNSGIFFILFAVGVAAIAVISLPKMAKNRK